MLHLIPYFLLISIINIGLQATELKNFYFLEYKNSPKQCDILSPAEKFILQQRGPTTAKENKEALAELNNLRNKISNFQNSEVREEQKKLLFEYFHQLSNLANRINFDKKNGVQCNFNWTSPLNDERGKVSEIPELNFELGSIIWNMAAWESQSALISHNYISAAKSLRLSAFLLLHVKEKFDIKFDQFPEFSSEQISIFSKLMLAQAQEAIYLQSKMKNMSVGALAQLMAPVADYLLQISTELKSNKKLRLHKEGLKNKSWIKKIRTKSKIYSLYANYLHALDVYEGSLLEKQKELIGVAIGRLNSTAIFVSNEKIRKKIDSFVKKCSDTLMREIWEEMNQKYLQVQSKLIKANNTIYFMKASILEINAITDLPSKNMVKTQILPEELNNSTDDSFKKLVNAKMLEISADYNKERSKYLQGYLEQSYESDYLLDSFLKELNIPSMIETADLLEQDISLDIKSIIQSIHDLGGHKRLQDLLDRKNLLRKNAKELLNTVQFRFKNNEFPESYRSDILQLESMIEMSLRVEEEILKKIGEIEKMIKNMSLGTSWFNNLLKNENIESNQNFGKARDEIANFFKELLELVEERSEIIQSIKEKKSEDPFYSKPIDKSLQNFENYLKEYFEQEIGALISNINAQSEILKELKQIQRNLFLQQGTKNTSEIEQVSQVKKNYQLFKEILGLLEKGIDFYTISLNKLEKINSYNTSLNLNYPEFFNF